MNSVNSVNTKLRETRIRLHPEDHERLRVAAAHTGLSMAEFVKQAALEWVLQIEQKQRPAREGQGDG